MLDQRCASQDQALQVPGAGLTYNGRCVGVIVDEHTDTKFRFLWHAHDCEHRDGEGRS
jgi:hypothetical protein